MLYLVVTMALILVVAGAVVLYAAYPHRGEDIPVAPWLGEVMTRAVEALPTVEPAETTETTETVVSAEPTETSGTGETTGTEEQPTDPRR